jgi:SAM-dependent methyltransferase
VGLRDLKDRFLAVPWVYDTIRPLAIGYIDHDRLARFCRVGGSDRVFDLGCGTARLVEHLRCERYLGVDLDSFAVSRARRFQGPHVRFMAGDDWDEAFHALAPTVVLMIGLVHHVSDGDFASIVARVRKASRDLPRIVTFETTYLSGYPLNNFLSRLDRGRFVRRPAEYDALFARNGLRVEHREILPTRLALARYIAYHLRFQ